MCTVTYIPHQNGYHLTSNRDEYLVRAAALKPNLYTNNYGSVIFPKDPKAGGTWILLKENGDSICLLNGAFKNFVPKENYGISRGKVVLKIADEYDMITAFFKMDLTDVAPFTLILVQNNTLTVCRWDGVKKHQQNLNEKLPYIFSSATLYDEFTCKKRSNWFEEWNKKNPNPSAYDIFNFHQFTGDGNTQTDLIINRNNILTTLSITAITVNSNECTMQYFDLKKHDNYICSFAEVLQPNF